MSKGMNSIIQAGFYKKILKFIYLGFSSFNNWRGDYQKALQKLNQAVLLDPDNPDIHWRLGCIYLKCLVINKAINHLQLAVELGQRKPKYLLWLSDAQNIAGNIQIASDLIEEVLDNNDQSSEAWFYKGKALVNQGLKEEGLKCFKKCVELEPNNINARNEIGCLYLALNQIMLALEAFQEGLKINNKDTSLLFNSGLIYLKLEQYEIALTYLEKAKKFKLECVELYNALGLCYSSLEQIDLAEDNYQKAFTLFPDNLELTCNLAAIKAKKGLYREALTLYEKSLKIEPYDTTILNNVAWCLEKLDKSEEAINYYYRALAKEPSNTIFRLNLSECLFKKGYLPEAIDHLEEILKNNTGNQKAWEVLGNIYDKMKLHAKAIDCFNKALGLE